jgi:hypothetical protein
MRCGRSPLALGLRNFSISSAMSCTPAITAILAAPDCQVQGFWPPARLSRRGRTEYETDRARYRDPDRRNRL